MSTPWAVVGLDLSLTSTGVAVLSAQGAELYPLLLRCVGEDGKRTDTYQQRSRRVRAQCRAIDLCIGTAVPEYLRPGAAGHHVALAVVEGPIYAGKLLPSYFDRAGLFHGVFGSLDARGVPIAVIPSTTGHQFVTGRGHPVDDRKSDIIAEVAKWWPQGPRIHNGDQADALGLALMGAMQLGHKPPFRPRARHYNALATATWPVGPQTPKVWA